MEEVKEIMEANIKASIERGENIDNLRAQSKDLQTSTDAFRKKTEAVEKAIWYKGMRFKIICAVVSVVLILVLIVVLVFLLKK